MYERLLLRNCETLNVFESIKEENINRKRNRSYWLFGKSNIKGFNVINNPAIVLGILFFNMMCLL